MEVTGNLMGSDKMDGKTKPGDAKHRTSPDDLLDKAAELGFSDKEIEQLRSIYDVTTRREPR